MKRFIESFQMWVLKVAEPWREEIASLDLEWRIFAQEHRAAVKRPRCLYKPVDLDPMDKMELYDEQEVEPEYLQKMVVKDYEAKTTKQDRSESSIKKDI